MARIKFKNKTHEILKSKFVEKKTFKWIAVTQTITLILLGFCLYRLFSLGDFQYLSTKLTTYLYEIIF